MEAISSAGTGGLSALTGSWSGRAGGVLPNEGGNASNKYYYRRTRTIILLFVKSDHRLHDPTVLFVPNFIRARKDSHFYNRGLARCHQGIG